MNAWAICSIAAVARPPDGGRVATWVDAWRGEVYAALYQGGREIESPTVEHPEAIVRRLGPGRYVFVGDGVASFTALIRETLGDRAVFVDPVSPLLAGVIARLAGEAAHAGVHTAPDAIRPMYVRRTDAELARDARAGQ